MYKTCCLLFECNILALFLINCHLLGEGFMTFKLSFCFIVSGEMSVYLVKIKVVSITSEMISYHFTID